MNGNPRTLSDPNAAASVGRLPACDRPVRLLYATTLKRERIDVYPRRAAERPTPR